LLVADFHFTPLHVLTFRGKPFFPQTQIFTILFSLSFQTQVQQRLKYLYVAISKDEFWNSDEEEKIVFGQKCGNEP